MKKLSFLLIPVLTTLLAAPAFAALTAAQIYELNNMNRTAFDNSMGQLISDAGDVTAGEITLLEGNVLVGSSSDVASALVASGDAKMLLGNGTTIASVSMSGDATISSAGALTIVAGAVDEAMLAVPAGNVLNAQRIAVAEYDFASDGGSVSSIGSGVTIPDNAVVTKCWYDVVTTATSSGDTATMAINLPTDGDLQAAVGIGTGTPYDVGFNLCDTKGGDDEDVSKYIKTTGAREITFVIASEDFESGKFKLYVEYVVSE